MFSKINKTKKSFIGAIAMSLVMLLGSAFSILIDTKVGQISPPTTTNTWDKYAKKPKGSGVVSIDPFIINTAEELAYLIDNLGEADWTIKLNNNIDLSGHNWVPIKTHVANTINFDGNGFEISNLTISLSTQTNVGLFAGSTGDISSALTVKILTFSNVNILGGSNVGVVAGRIYQKDTIIENVIVKSGVVVSKGDYVGSIMGCLYPKYSARCQVTNCINSAKVVSYGSVCGGLLGEAHGFILMSKCINVGELVGVNIVGGLVGKFWADASMGDCYANCTITAQSTVGGIAGSDYSAGVNRSGFCGTINLLEGEHINVSSMIAETGSVYAVQDCFGIAEIIYLSGTDLSEVNADGIGGQMGRANNYSYSKIITSEKIIQYRKYNGATDNFADWAYCEYLNEGYPFPKSLFAIGQFIENEISVLEYLQSFGFTE